MSGRPGIELPTIIMRRQAVGQQAAAGDLRLANRQVQQGPAGWRCLVSQKRAHLREHIAVEKTVFRVQLHDPPFRICHARQGASQN